jgi:hypothetical protein
MIRKSKSDSHANEPTVIKPTHVSRAWASVFLRIIDGRGAELSPLVLSLAAVRSKPSEAVRDRTNDYLNNRLEQDRGIKDRYRPMRRIKSAASAERFCGAIDELRRFLRVRSFHWQPVAADRRRLRQLRCAVIVLGIFEAA